LKNCKAQYHLMEGYVECDMEEGHEGNHIFAWGDTD